MVGNLMRTSFNFSNRGGFRGECKPRGSELEGGARKSNVHLGFVDEPLFLTKYWAVDGNWDCAPWFSWRSSRCACFAIFIGDCKLSSLPEGKCIFLFELKVLEPSSNAWFEMLEIVLTMIVLVCSNVAVCGRDYGGSWGNNVIFEFNIAWSFFTFSFSAFNFSSSRASRISASYNNL